MIKTITVPNWPEIQNRVENLSEDQKAAYTDLKRRYEEETQKPNPNHETIASLISEAQKMIFPLKTRVEL